MSFFVQKVKGRHRSTASPLGVELFYGRGIKITELDSFDLKAQSNVALATDFEFDHQILHTIDLLGDGVIHVDITAVTGNDRNRIFAPDGLLGVADQNDGIGLTALCDDLKVLDHTVDVA